MHVDTNICGYLELLSKTFVHHRRKEIHKNKAAFHESGEALICETSVSLPQFELNRFSEVNIDLGIHYLIYLPFLVWGCHVE